MLIAGLGIWNSSNRTESTMPDLTVAKYAPSPAETRMMPGIYRAGDVMANSSLNAAMESGRAAAAAVKEDLFK